MVEIQLREIGAVLGIVIGAGIAGYGLFTLADGYTTMKQIEALGVTGQLTARDEYTQAANDFEIGLFSTFIGSMVTLAGLLQNQVVEFGKEIEKRT